MANYEDYHDNERRVSTTDKSTITRRKGASQRILGFVRKKDLEKH